MKLQLKHGDCLEVLKTLEDNSIDSIVTDPPYGLSFMNKRWDYDVPSVEVWKECLRVLKPGGHLLSFGGSRTYHRMAVRIEDAGFEIRDQIMWIYGSGFPKSHNIGKAIDKLQGNEREVVGPSRYNKLRKNPGNSLIYKQAGHQEIVTKGQSEFEGWGTALKPAHEPIVVARKPLSEKSVAENVLKWGTGAINIDESRIKHNEPIKVMKAQEGGNKVFGQGGRYEETTELKEEGRWPANIILDEEAGKVLDEQTGELKPATSRTSTKPKNPTSYSSGGNANPNQLYNDKGGASRFFYVAKASKKDRDEGLNDFPDYKKYEDTSSDNHSFSHLVKDKDKMVVKNVHPTVKPTSLMEYLIKLVTPKGGTVLDPFMGSGSTGKAAVKNNYGFVGIEREMDYIRIAEARILYENK